MTDGQTDRQTDGRTDGRAIAYSALSMLSRAKNESSVEDGENGEVYSITEVLHAEKSGL